MTLRADIQSWDGRSADPIRAIYEAHHAAPRFTSTLINLARDAALQAGATWLLKHHLADQGQPITSAAAAKLYALATRLHDWPAKLHLLQCMPHAPVPAEHTARVASFLEDCLHSDNKFVRAWAYSGYADLAAAHPKYKNRAAQLLEDGLRHDPAPAVRARIRQRLKATCRRHTPPPNTPRSTTPMPLIAPGKKAPAFNLKDQDGNTHKLSDYAGKPLILFFYPKDMTSGCTTEACDFLTLLPKFKRSKAPVLGISILPEKSKKKFAEKEGLSYPLLADNRTNDEGKPDPVVAAKYGVWVEKSMYGRTYMGIDRTTYLIDAHGKVAQRWDKVKVPGHAEEVLAAVKEL